MTRQDMMATIKTTNIQNRNGNLYFRLKVPKDCRAALKNKREIVKSLRIREDRMAEAVVKTEEMTVEWNETFEKIRKSPASQTLAVTMPTGRLLEETVRTQLLHRNAVKTVDELLMFSDLIRCENRLQDIKEEHDRVQDLLNRDELDEEVLKSVYNIDLLGAYDQNKGLVVTSIDKIRDSERDDFVDGEDLVDHSVWTLAQALGAEGDRRALRGILRALRDELEYITKEIINEFPKLNVMKQWEPLIQADAVVAQPASATPPAPNAPTPPSVGEVLKECLAAKERTTATDDRIRGEVLSLLSWLKMDGSKTPITNITVNHIIDYRDNCLKHLILNANKLKHLKGQPVRKQVAYSKKHGSEPISIRTLNNRLANLSVLFGYANKKHYVPFAVSEGLQLNNPKRQAKLSGTLFNGYNDTQMTDLVEYLEKHKTDHKPGKEWRYWIPLLLAYTGCRANEVAMLTVDDVIEEDGIWYLDLHADAEKRQRVKNSMSVRRVPVCEKVIELGFIKHVEGVRKKVSPRRNKEGRLWGTLTYCEKNKWVRQLSHYFNKTVRPEIGAKEVSSGLHGLRSSVSRALQRQGTEQRVIDEITGHQPGDISRVALGYQGRLELKVLVKALNKLSWEDKVST